MARGKRKTIPGGFNGRLIATRTYAIVSNEDLSQTFLETKSIAATGREHGIGSSTVRRRLTKGGFLTDAPLGRGPNVLHPPTAEDLWETFGQLGSLQKTADAHHTTRTTVRKKLTEAGYLSPEPLPTGSKRKPIDIDDLANTYRRAGTYAATGREHGLSGPHVGQLLKEHEDLNGQGRFTDAEVARLQADYQTYVAEGRLQDLADELGRSLPALHLKARKLGLTRRSHPRLHQRTWAAMNDDELRYLLGRLKESGLSMVAFCNQEGLSPHKFASTMRARLLGEYREVVRQGWAGDGREFVQGFAFEHEVAERLMEIPFVIADVSPQSRGPADLTVFTRHGVYLIQAKLSGYLEPREWNQLWEMALEQESTPLLVERRGDEHVFWLLTGPKTVGGKRGAGSPQPRERVYFGEDASLSLSAPDLAN